MKPRIWGRTLNVWECFRMDWICHVKNFIILFQNLKEFIKKTLQINNLRRKSCQFAVSKMLNLLSSRAEKIYLDESWCRQILTQMWFTHTRIHFRTKAIISKHELGNIRRIAEEWPNPKAPSIQTTARWFWVVL